MPSVISPPPEGWAIRGGFVPGLLLGVGLLLAGCAGPAAPSRPGPVTVFAAASLTDAFQQMAEAYAAAGAPGQVVLNFAGSQQLLSQLREGARADIFAAASEAQMQAAVEAGRIEPESVRVFACNRLAVAVREEAAGAIRELADLARPGHKIVIGAEAVPVGAYTGQFLQRAAASPGFGPAFRQGFEANVVSAEQSVRVVLSKVLVGEADAGIVYASDLHGLAGVEALVIPPELNVSAAYWLGLLADAPQAEQAAEFVAYILSAEGAAVLASFGFSTECREALSRGDG